MSDIRVLLVDDSVDFLEVVAEWLTADSGIEVVGTADSGGEAVEAARRLRPDVVLMDVTMPGINGFEATRRIKSEADAPIVILLTFHDSETARNEAWAAGADDLIAKVHVTDSLLGRVRSAVAGRNEDRATSRTERKSSSSTRRTLPTDIIE